MHKWEISIRNYDEVSNMSNLNAPIRLEYAIVWLVGEWAPPGKYSLTVYTLRLYGNRNKKEDFDICDSGELRYV